MSDNIKYYQTIPRFNIKGRQNTPEEFDKIGLPKDLTGKTVLDIGCNIGAFMFECIERGAEFCQGVEPNFDWRVILLGLLEVDSDGLWQRINVEEDLNPLDAHGFDMTLLLSVLHLIEDPQLMLNNAWLMTADDGLLIVEVNDRLQEKKFEWPKDAEVKLYGKNKDNRSVYHLTKNNK